MKRFLKKLFLVNNLLIKGPETWPYDPSNPQCAGSNQSPVNIQDWYAKFDPTLTIINFNNYDIVTNWNSTNNGHTGMKDSFTDMIDKSFLCFKWSSIHLIAVQIL